MSQLPTRNRFYRIVWMADSRISTATYELGRWLRSAGFAYSAWLHRWFRLSGLKRVVVDLADDGFTFAIVAAAGLLAYALPPFSGQGDIWNRGRDFAITFTDQDGKLIGRRGILQNDAIPMEEIPLVMIKAALATEDARFYDHFGVDVIGTLRALVHNTRGGSKQGGSSITQQVVKNLFLSPERTMKRKVNEAFLSLWVEERLTKNQILKLYLDRSYMGGGTYGVEAASQFYFGKSVRDINLSESAVLAGLFKAPTQYAPSSNPEASKTRANVVLFRMLDAGYITQGELLQAQRNPAQIVTHDILPSPNWFLDWAYQNTLDIMERQGLKTDYVVEVKTTIDMRLQDASQKILNDVVDNEGSKDNFEQAASISMSPDGAVRAIVGGRDYEESQFNRATSAKRQVGSSFKPFVYLTALEHGYNRRSFVEDTPVCVGTWCVHNFEPGFRGNVQLWEALTHSINTVAVRLMLDVGRKNVEATARRLGIQGQIDQYPTMAIGTSALTLFDMTTAYSTIASDGKLARPYAVLEIRKPNGDLLYTHGTNEPDAPQVDPPDKVSELISMMHDVVMQGTATKAQLGYAPVAGKTGTNANFRDAWFLGFTAHYVTGVWVGNDDNSSMDSSKENAVTGGHVPAPAWKRIMDVAEFGLKPLGLPGAPLDASYTPPLKAIADQALTGFNVVPVAVATLSAKPDEEVVAMPETGDQADTASRDLLNGMLDLFQPAAAVAASAPAQQAFHPHTIHVHKLPPVHRAYAPLPTPPPRTRSLFELLFGRH